MIGNVRKHSSNDRSQTCGMRRGDTWPDGNANDQAIRSESRTCLEGEEMARKGRNVSSTKWEGSHALD